MKIKKLLLIPMAVLGIFSISSCSYINDFINGSGIENILSQLPSADTTTETKITEVQKDETYKVIWKNENETLKTIDSVKGDEIPEYDGEAPTKAEDDKYTYTFSDWNKTVDDKNHIVTFNAVFNKIYKIDTELKDWGYNDLQLRENKNALINFYDDVNKVCSDFYNSKIDAIDKTDSKGNSFKAVGDDIDYYKYSLTSADAKMVYACVLLDHPEYYFTNGVLSGYSAKTLNGVETERTEYITITCNNEYASNETRKEYKTAIDNYLLTISNLVKNVTDNTKKVLKIHDYIVNNASYALDSNGDPDSSSYSHNILGIILNKKGVCESYAELFQLLLINNNINCVRVSGNAKSSVSSSYESHAWNYAEVDGDWYAFDVTWDDPVVNGGTINKLTHDYFGKGSDTGFFSNHITQPTYDMDYGVNYLYKLPTLNKTDLEWSYIL